MSNPTKEERVRKLYKEGEEVILAGGGRRLIPRRDAVFEAIHDAEKQAWLDGIAEQKEEQEFFSQELGQAESKAPPPVTKDPIHVSLLMNVDQDKAKGSFMLHDWIDIAEMDFQSAVRVADHCFKLAVVELRQALHAWKNAPPESIHKK